MIHGKRNMGNELMSKRSGNLFIIDQAIRY
jgi:hypothetical protein